MDNYFMYTVYLGLFVCYVVLPPPAIIFKYKKDKCYKITKEEVSCEK